MKIHDLDYGESGSGKSEFNKATAKQAVRENPGKKIKLIVNDGSLATWEALISAGICEYVEVGAREYPLTVTDQLSAGWWPKDWRDPSSPLVKPTADSLDSYCFTMFEGASVLGKYIMGGVKGGMAWRAANGEQMGPDAIVSIRDGEYDDKGKLIGGSGNVYGTNGTAHYMAAQNHMVECINRSRSLRGHVAWSAHEVIMDDMVNIGDLKNPVKVRKGVVIGGPECCGKALTPNLQRLFNNTRHHQVLGKAVKDAKELDDFTGTVFNDHETAHRVWTREHFAQSGATNVKYKALTRNVDDSFPVYFDGKMGQNALDYYLALHNAKLKELESM